MAKKRLTIKGIFNDVFTGYKDKESSVSMTVDDEEDCTCGAPRRCIIHDLLEGHTLTDIPEKESEE